MHRQQRAKRVAHEAGERENRREAQPLFCTLWMRNSKPKYPASVMTNPGAGSLRKTLNAAIAALNSKVMESRA
ncbi:hypothetical protein [Polaromonas sp. Pch-P]|uniref:hypothetical protein n=1 Tax=Polaromonas sp. Pch-P TaxID=2082385 RepID=UPI001E465BDC|nr:hypothetical protein [Polaromonas sp. Pch-P]